MYSEKDRLQTMILRQIKSKKKKVEFILEFNRETRNDDKLLILKYWKLVDKIEDLDQILSAANPEVIQRARRIVQNKEGKFLPTRSDVLKRRRIQAEGVRKNIHKV